MPSFSKAILMGHLSRDPDLRYTPKGAPVADLGVAVNYTFSKDGGEKVEQVSFVDVTVWGSQAENCKKFLSKGSGVFIDGRLHMDSWDDKETGKKRHKLKVVAERVLFLNGGKGGNKSADETPELESTNSSTNW